MGLTHLHQVLGLLLACWPKACNYRRSCLTYVSMCIKQQSTSLSRGISDSKLWSPSYTGGLGKILYVRLENITGHPCLLQLYSLAIKFPVGIPQPAQGRLVLTGQAMVQVHQSVVTLHILVQCEFQVPEKKELNLCSATETIPPFWTLFVCHNRGFATPAMELSTWDDMSS